VYLQAEPALQPCVGLWLTVLLAAAAPRLVHDREFGSIVSRKAADPIDGGPLIAGVSTLLKQMHPSVTDDLLAHAGQYVRSVVHATIGATVAASATTKAADKELARAAPTLPAEVVTFMLLLQQVARVSHVPDRVLHAHVPAHLLDALYAQA